jgi:hypothetical protein
MANSAKLKNSQYKAGLEASVRACEAIRRDTESPQDITLAEYYQANSALSMEDLYTDLGLNPCVDTISNIVNLPDPSLRWLIPEIFRDAVRLGLRKNPIYPSLIAGEQSVKQTSITMPAINMSEAVPHMLGVAETIPVGDVSFDKKTVKIYKMGRGIKVPYEVMQYVSLNLVAVWMQDFGVKLGMGIDTLAINTLLNGDQANGSESISTIGITTANDLVFRDLLRVWVRGSRLGKSFGTMVAGENVSMDILDLLTNTRYFGTPRATVNVKTPIPNNSDLFVHGAVPANQVIILDPSSTLIKLNAQPLLVETEKIVSNQTEATYATLTTGFTTIFRDSRINMDTSLLFAGNGFPTWMGPTSQEIVNFPQ